MPKLGSMGTAGIRGSGRAAVLALAILLGPPPPWAASESSIPPERRVEYQKDALTVRLTKVPLSEVLDEIGRQSGAEIRGQVRNPGDVTAEFEAVPLAEALHRLLGDQNFALIYADRGRLKAVKLLGGPQAGGPPVAAAPAAPIPARSASPVSSADELVRLFARQPPVPVTGRLAQALGGASSATLMQIINLALHGGDIGIRSDAVRTVLPVVEGTPELHSSVLATMNTLDGPDFAPLIHKLAGEHGAEVLTHVATHAKTNEVKVRAAALLPQIRGLHLAETQPGG